MGPDYGDDFENGDADQDDEQFDDFGFLTVEQIAEYFEDED